MGRCITFVSPFILFEVIYYKPSGLIICYPFPAIRSCWAPLFIFSSCEKVYKKHKNGLTVFATASWTPVMAIVNALPVWDLFIHLLNDNENPCGAAVKLPMEEPGGEQSVCAGAVHPAEWRGTCFEETFPEVLPFS